MTARKREYHGMNESPEYNSWALARSRCTNPNAVNYAYYGGRGIRMCERWASSFAAFYADMGPKPSPQHSLDRWPDNNGDYEPGNCRWATKKEQAINRKTTRMVNVPGVGVMSLKDASAYYGITYLTVIDRLRNDWSIADALLTPAGNRNQFTPKWSDIAAGRVA